MMLDEPYRWAEAVSNRRDYIEDQLRGGSPVVGVGYRDGALLLTLGPRRGKIFEIYDQIAMAGIGHPTDIEKLRQAAIDMASVIGFNYSDADVALQQIVHFGLGPTVKAAFDEIIRSPFIVRMLLVELGGVGEDARFCTVDYDGVFYPSEGAAALAGIPEADRLMQRRLSRAGARRRSLKKAVDIALETWAIGRWVATVDEIPKEASDREKVSDEADLDVVLRKALEELEVEAAVVHRSGSRKRGYRVLSDKEIQASVKAYQA